MDTSTYTESEVAAMSAASTTPARIMLDEHGTNTHGITASFELLTPEDAIAILLHSDFTNRPLRKTIVDRYTNAMAKGEWKLAPEPLVITDKHQLIQGQHRLNAVVLSKTNQWFMVVRGWRTEVFDVLDSGAKRSVSDVLNINGTAGGNGSRLGAAAKLVVALDEAKRLGQSSHNATKKMSDRQHIIAFAEQNYDALEWAYHVTEPIYRAKVLSVPPTALLSAAFIIARAGNDRDIVATFFEELTTLHDISDPRWTLVRWAPTRKGRSGPGEMAAAIVVKGWNSWVRGRKQQQFAWRSDEDFPEVLVFGAA